MKAHNYIKKRFVVGILLVAFLASALSGCIDQSSGDGLEIVPIGRDSASGTREFFFEAVMQEEEFAATILEKNSNGAVKTTVEQTPGAVGFVGMGYLDSSIKALEVGGVEATVANVLSGDYPIARDLNMFTDGEPTGIAAEFLAYIDSDEGQEIVADEGFVPKASTTGAYSVNSAITSGTLTIAGSTTVLPIAELAAEAFEELYPDVDVVVSSGGSSVGVQSAGSGSADIGMASRELKYSEQSDYPDLVKHVVCGDGIAIIVHASNNYVDSITMEQIKSLFKGEIENWNEF